MIQHSPHPFLKRLLALGAATLLLALPQLHGAYGDLVWSKLTGDIIFGAPAIGPDGEIVVGSEDTRLYSYDPDGTLRWIFNESTDWLDASPTIADDGTVYVGSWDNFLYAVDGNTGNLKWRFETGAMIEASVALGADGTVFLASTDSFLYALNPDGSQKWVSTEVDNFSPISSSPVISRDGGTVYFGNESGEIFAVNATSGAPEWRFAATDIHPISGDASAAVGESLALGEDGSLYFGTEDSNLYALSPEGNLRWSYEAAGAIRSAPVLSNDGLVYFVASDGYLYALDTEGFQLWETFVGDVFYCTPAIASDGRITVAGYAGSSETGAATRFVTLDHTGSLVWEFLIEGYNDSSPNIGPDGSLYIGAHDGSLYKFEGSAPLLNGGWPRFQGNHAQTGLRFNASSPEASVFEVFPSISQTEGNWHFVPWFGSGWITPVGLPWVIHTDHGYIYVTGAGSDAVWFYDAGLAAWIFASASSPNYYYNTGSASWIYHIPGSARESAGGRWFYDYTRADWFSEGGG